MCAVGNHQIGHKDSWTIQHKFDGQADFTDQVYERGELSILSAQDQLLILKGYLSKRHIHRVCDDGSLEDLHSMCNWYKEGHHVTNLGLYIQPRDFTEKPKHHGRLIYECVDHDSEVFGNLTLNLDEEIKTICGNFVLVTGKNSAKLIKIIKHAKHAEFKEISLSPEVISNPLDNYYQSIGDRFIVIAEQSLTNKNQYNLVTLDVVNLTKKLQFTVDKIFNDFPCDFYVWRCGHSIVMITDKLYFFDQQNVEFKEIEKHGCCTLMVPLSYNNTKKIYDAIYNTTGLPRACIEIILGGLNIKLL